MIKGLYTAYTGMVNEQKRLDVLTNNLANADTNGYKKEGTTSQTFADELAIKIKDTSSYGLNKKLGVISMGVHLGETYTNYDQGSIKVTDNETDVALAGNGFFAIAILCHQIALCIHGKSSISCILHRSFPCFIRKSNCKKSIYQNDQLVTRIGVVDFDDYNYISKYGENLYDLVDGGQITASDAKVQQGCIEGSNVNVVDEMVKMITISRAYQAGQKVINTVDETLDKTVNQVGKV